MFEFIKSLIKSATPKTYKIVHDPEFGYAACWYDGHRWVAIDKAVIDTVGLQSSMHEVWRNKYWCETEAQAGNIINKHANGRGQAEIWSA